MDAVPPIPQRLFLPPLAMADTVDTDVMDATVIDAVDVMDAVDAMNAMDALDAVNTVDAMNATSAMAKNVCAMAAVDGMVITGYQGHGQVVMDLMNATTLAQDCALSNCIGSQ